MDDSSDEPDAENDDIDESSIEINVMDINTEVPHQGMADMDLQDTPAMVVEEQELVTEVDTFVVDTKGDETLVHTSEQETSLFVVDTAGDEGLAASAKPLNPRVASPTRSDSSEEKIVFHGRKQARVVNDPVPALFARGQERAKALAQNPAAKAQASNGNTFKPADSWDLHNRLNPMPATSAGIGNRSSKAEKPAEKWSPVPTSGWPTPTTQSSTPALTAKGASAKDTASNSDPDAEETIASLQAEWKQALREKKAAKPNTSLSNDNEQPKTQPSRRRGKKGRKKGNRALKATLDEDDDLAAEAAYDDYMANLAAQLDEEVDGDEASINTSGLKAFANSSGLAGPSMMVDGKIIADDEVLPSRLKLSKSTGPSAEASDESAWVSDDSDASQSESSDVDQSELEDEIEYNEKQMYEDEDDLRQRRIERMEDEELARLFAKQEQFGIISDELMIEAGDFDLDELDDSFGDIDAARAGLANITNLIQTQSASKQGKRRGRRDPNHFPSASALADTLDQYGDNGFDIMDFDRPSLKPKKKGRKGAMPPELAAISDDDLRETLTQSWDKDRDKKRQKKLEREELRMDGLLGKAARTGKTDLTAKYSTGMTLKQAFDELHIFLLATDLQQRTFPPMAKADRKALHDICQHLNLNSKSQGSGKARFPVITKTARTPGPGDAGFEAFIDGARTGAFSNLGQIYKLRNTLARASRGGALPPRRMNAGASKAGTTLRNGEIVGASAARIGAESFGHRMMQKMGWQEGKGLGQAGEGLVDPVEQRMRFGTAGLG